MGEAGINSAASGNVPAPFSQWAPVCKELSEGVFCPFRCHARFKPGIRYAAAYQRNLRG
jgi:hypothetical protein